MNPDTGVTVLFICTGNIFRSMTAEHALRAALEPDTDIFVHSAGLIEAPHEIVTFVSEYLSDRGIDLSGHRPRKLQPEMLESADLAVAMDIEHRRQIEKKYQRRLPLFSELAYATESSMLDVYEVVPDWRNNEAAARKYGCSVMDTIFDGMPGFIKRMPRYINR